MQPIFLIGFMCSGKTTLGRAIAASAGLNFIDLDAEIVSQTGRTINQIFAIQGQKAFRQIESEILAKCAQSPNTIIATGGGTPCSPGAMELMNELGLTVWLMPDETTLIERLMQGREQRPLLHDLHSRQEFSDFATSMLAQRQPYYSLSQAVFDSSLLESPEQISDSTARFIDQFVKIK